MLADICIPQPHIAVGQICRQIFGKCIRTARAKIPGKNSIVLRQAARIAVAVNVGSVLGFDESEAEAAPNVGGKGRGVVKVPISVGKQRLQAPFAFKRCCAVSSAGIPWRGP